MPVTRQRLTNVANINITFPLTKGLDRTMAPSKADAATFYTLQNWRQSRTALGMLEQTPRFYLVGTVAQGTYWNGVAGVSEPTTSAVYWKQYSVLGNNLLMTSYVLRDTVMGQRKGIYQTTAPATDGVTKGCLLRFVNIATASINLGGTYDVEIDGAATFKWRVNGGGYTAGVAIDMTNGNLIDGGTVRLSWLASAGFTIGDAWSWLRTDSLGPDVPLTQPPSSIQLNDRIIFTANRVMVIDKDTVGLTPYVRSLGYRPVSGRNVMLYEDHLFVTSTNGVIICSDLSNLDCFTPTDVNEADIIDLRLVSTGSVQYLYALAFTVINSRLFVLTTSGIFFSDYAGLPTPFTFKLLIPFRIGYNTVNIAVSTDQGCYFCTDTELYRFDGQSLSLITNFEALGLVTPQRILWNPIFREVLVADTRTVLVYQEKYGLCHTRKISISTAEATGVDVDVYGNIVLGGASRTHFGEDINFAQTPVYDSSYGVSFAEPTIVTQVVGGASQVKETCPVIVAATAATGTSANYSVDGYIKLVLGWFASSDGKISGTAATDDFAFWTNESADGQISFPRVATRYIAYQLTLTGTDGTKPPGSTTIQAIETKLYQDGAER